MSQEPEQVGATPITVDLHPWCVGKWYIHAQTCIYPKPRKATKPIAKGPQLFFKHQDEQHNENCAIPQEVSIEDHILGESLTEATRALEHNTQAHTHVLYISKTEHQSHEP